MMTVGSCRDSPDVFIENFEEMPSTLERLTLAKRNLSVVYRTENSAQISLAYGHSYGTCMHVGAQST